ncbi:MAG TPA: TRAP transporter substrate-binding protein DctP [Polaromonas sp.]
MAANKITVLRLPFFFAVWITALLGVSAHAQVHHLKWAHVYEPTETFHTQAQAAARKIFEQSGGKIVIEVVPSSKAGKEADYPSMLAQDSIQMAYVGIAILGKDYPPLLLGHFPFAFKDVEHVRRFLVSALFGELMKGYQDKTGNRMVAGVYYGARHVTSNQPIQRLEDFRGKRCRVPDAPAYRLFASAMGATPVTIPFADVYGALKSGQADMQENPLPTIKSKRFYEVQKYVALTSHIYDNLGIVVNGPAWNRLSREQQDLMEKVLADAALWASVSIISAEMQDEQTLKEKGMTILRADRDLLRERVVQFASPEQLGLRSGDYERLRGMTRKDNLASVPSQK